MKTKLDIPYSVSVDRLWVEVGEISFYINEDELLSHIDYFYKDEKELDHNDLTEIEIEEIESVLELITFDTIIEN